MSTVFFFLSKIAWFLLKPLHSFLFLLLAWLVARGLGWARLARFCLVLLLIYSGVVSLD